MQSFSAYRMESSWESVVLPLFSRQTYNAQLLPLFSQALTGTPSLPFHNTTRSGLAGWAAVKPAGEASTSRLQSAACKPFASFCGTEAPLVVTAAHLPAHGYLKAIAVKRVSRRVHLNSRLAYSIGCSSAGRQDVLWAETLTGTQKEAVLVLVFLLSITTQPPPVRGGEGHFPFCMPPPPLSRTK